MRVLGAVLAGGLSRRFGSDKAAALFEGTTLLERVLRTLSQQCDAVLVCGGPGGIADRPAGGHGPLAGINAALHAGAAGAFDAVLSAPCDAPLLPADLRTQLAGDGPAYVAGLPVIGFWPCSLAATLDAHLAGESDRSLRRWTARIGARAVRLPDDVPNINTPEDLARLARPKG